MRPAIKLVKPLPYVPFVDLMQRAHVLLTDSGGIQEEGPSLGTDPDRIVAETALLLEDDAEYLRRSRVHNPSGDGRASAGIRDIIRSRFAMS